MSGAIAATAPVPAGGDAATAAKEHALLTKLLQTYQTDINGGQSASSLSALAKQITTAAKQLGVNVALPKATTSTAPAAAPPAAPAAQQATPPTPTPAVAAAPAAAAADTSKVNLRA